MANFAAGNTMIIQSGGPSPVVNKTLGHLINAAKENGATSIGGSLFGYKGILNKNIIDLAASDDRTLKAVANMSGMALGSLRKEPTPEECGQILEKFKKMDVRYLFYIGGDNTARTTYLVDNAAKSLNYELTCIHVPKTIDNDLLEPHHRTPGHLSAALYVIRALAGIEMDNRALPGVHIVVTMGKNAGYLAAAASLLSYSNPGLPHRIFVPEVEFDKYAFRESVESLMSVNGRAVIVVSEGVWSGKNDEGKRISLAKSLGGDGFGGESISGTSSLGDLLVRFVKEIIRVDRARQDTLGYSQRSFFGLFSEQDALDAKIVAYNAVHYALTGQGSCSVALLPPKFIGKRNRYPTAPADLGAIGNGKREMPASFLSQEGCGISREYLNYALPLFRKNELPVLFSFERKFWVPSSKGK